MTGEKEPLSDDTPVPAVAWAESLGTGRLELGVQAALHAALAGAAFAFGGPALVVAVVAAYAAGEIARVVVANHVAKSIGADVLRFRSAPIGAAAITRPAVAGAVVAAFPDVPEAWMVGASVLFATRRFVRGSRGLRAFAGALLAGGALPVVLRTAGFPEAADAATVAMALALTVGVAGAALVFRNPAAARRARGRSGGS